MRKIVKGTFGFVGAAIGWNLAGPAGDVVAVFAAIVGVAVGIYFANRLYLFVYG